MNTQQTHRSLPSSDCHSQTRHHHHRSTPLITRSNHPPLRSASTSPLSTATYGAVREQSPEDSDQGDVDDEDGRQPEPEQVSTERERDARDADHDRSRKRPRSSDLPRLLEQHRKRSLPPSPALLYPSGSLSEDPPPHHHPPQKKHSCHDHHFESGDPKQGTNPAEPFASLSPHHDSHYTPGPEYVDIHLKQNTDDLSSLYENPRSLGSASSDSAHRHYRDGRIHFAKRASHLDRRNLRPYPPRLPSIRQLLGGVSIQEFENILRPGRRSPPAHDTKSQTIIDQACQAIESDQRPLSAIALREYQQSPIRNLPPRSAALSTNSYSLNPSQNVYLPVCQPLEPGQNPLSSTWTRDEKSPVPDYGNTNTPHSTASIPLSHAPTLYNHPQHPQERTGHQRRRGASARPVDEEPSLLRASGINPAHCSALNSQHARPCSLVSTTTAPRQRVSIACTFCRARKLRCTPKPGPCEHCLRRGHNCTYDSPPPASPTSPSGPTSRVTVASIENQPQPQQRL